MEKVALLTLLFASAILCIAIGVAAVFYTGWAHRLSLRLARSNKVLSWLAPEWYGRYLEWSERYLDTKFAFFRTRISGVGFILVGIAYLIGFVCLLVQLFVPPP